MWRFSRWFSRGLGLLCLSLTLNAADQATTPPAKEAFPELPAWFHESFLHLPDEVAEAKASGRRLMLYFHQDGCPYCARLLRENFGDPALAARTRELYRVIALNLWGDRELTDLAGKTTTEKQFAESLKVMYTPSLLLLKESGEIALRINGYYPKERFALALEYGSGQAEAGESFRDFVARRQTSPAPAGTLRSEPFFLPPPHDLKQLLAGNHKHLLVIYEQSHCPACDEMHDKALRIEANRRLLERLDVIQLDTRGQTPLVTPDGERLTAAAWADRLGIKYTPSLVFFDDQGQEVFRVEAFLWSFHFQSALEYVATLAYREQPNFQRFLQARRERLREQGKEVKLQD